MKLNRRMLSRLYMPRPLLDLIQHLAGEKGFHESEAYIFVYEALRDRHRAEVKHWEKTNKLNPDWLYQYKVGDEMNGE